MRRRSGLLTALAAVLLAAGAGYCQYLEATIPVGDTPGDILWNPTSNKVYCVNEQDGTVSVISGETNQVIATVAVPDYPIFLEWNSTGNKVYCASGEYDRLAVIDGAGDTLLGSLRVPGYPNTMAYNARMNKLYIDCYDNGRVAIIDGGPDTLLRNLTVCGDYVGTTPAWHPTTNRIFLSLDGADSVKVIDCATDTVVESLATWDQPWRWCYNPANDLMYVTTRHGVHVLTAEGDSIVASVPGYASDLVSVPCSNKVYVAGAGPSGAVIRVIDGDTQQVSDSILVGGGWMRLVSDSVAGKVYCSNINAHKVDIVDALADTLIKSIPLGRSPQFVCWNWTNSRVYISDEMDNVVYVIRDTSSGVTEEPAAQPQARTKVTYVRDELFLSDAGPANLVDVAGRVVAHLGPGSNNVSMLSPGVYAVVCPSRPRCSRVVKVR